MQVRDPLLTHPLRDRRIFSLRSIVITGSPTAPWKARSVTPRVRPATASRSSSRVHEICNHLGRRNFRHFRPRSGNPQLSPSCVPGFGSERSNAQAAPHPFHGSPERRRGWIVPLHERSSAGLPSGGFGARGDTPGLPRRLALDRLAVRPNVSAAPVACSNSLRARSSRTPPRCARTP